jgi:hypothetical protein
VSPVIEVELRWQSGARTGVAIRLVPDQGPPLERAAADDFELLREPPEHEIDGYVLRSATSLITTLASWARLLSADDEQVVHARCLESRAPTVVTFLDPDNTGTRPIPVDVPPPKADG